MSLYVVHASSLYVYYVKPLVVASILDYFDVSLSVTFHSCVRENRFNALASVPQRILSLTAPPHPVCPNPNNSKPKSRAKGGVTRLGKRLAEKC